MKKLWCIAVLLLFINTVDAQPEHLLFFELHPFELFNAQLVERKSAHVTEATVRNVSMFSSSTPRTTKRLKGSETYLFDTTGRVIMLYANATKDTIFYKRKSDDAPFPGNRNILIGRDSTSRLYEKGRLVAVYRVIDTTRKVFFDRVFGSFVFDTVRFTYNRQGYITRETVECHNPQGLKVYKAKFRYNAKGLVTGIYLPNRSCRIKYVYAKN